MTKEYTPEEVLEKLKRYWKVEELVFVAQYHLAKTYDGIPKKDRNGNSFGFFQNFRLNDRTLYYPKEEGYEFDFKVSIFYPALSGIKDDEYYNVSLEVDSDQKRKINPFQLKVKGFNKNEDFETPREFIKDWFVLKGESPQDARTIAGQLKLNELELYTETERFFFELLQNADDMPVGKFVDVKVRLLEDHLAFMHNGQHFQREHVKAIADAAQSSKKGDVTKTGYKGIGFKSVFSDSETVYIKSSDYSFKFDKTYFLNNSFDKIYEGYFNSKNEEERKKRRRQFEGSEANYENIDSIPWQIKPIWVNFKDYPDEIANIEEFRLRQFVSFFLKIGHDTIIEKAYEEKMVKLLNEPRFLIFLRHIRSISFNQGQENEIKIDVEKLSYRTTITLNDREPITYIPFSSDIALSNEEFKKAGFTFRKESNGDVVRFIENGKELKGIPEKIHHLEKTQISFAAKLYDGRILPLKSDESILFNYLPTSDRRFGFPVLVNGDFITKTDREFILQENKWNHFLLYNIGYSLVKWAEELASIEFPYYSNINVLPQALLNEKDEKVGEINKAFNRGLQDGLGVFSVILDTRSQSRKTDEVIIDQSEFRGLLGDYIYKKFIGEQKALIHRKVEIKTRQINLLGIEVVNIEGFIPKLFSERGKRILIGALKRLSLIDYRKFLSFMNEKAEFIRSLGFNLNDLPLFSVSRKFKGEIEINILSAEELFQDAKLILPDTEIENGKSILQNIRFKVLPYNIDDYSQLKSSLDLMGTYLLKKEVLFDRIAENENISEIEPKQKVELLDFLISLDENFRIPCFKRLKLFKNYKGEASVLYDLVSNKVRIPWLSSFLIDSKEEQELGEFSKKLGNNSNIYSRFIAKQEFREGILAKLENENLDAFYEEIYSLYCSCTTKAKVKITELSIIWSGNSFKSAKEFYFHPKLQNSPVSYLNIKKTIESLTGLICPGKETLKFIEDIEGIEEHRFSWKRSTFVAEIRYSVGMEESEAHDFLGYLNSLDAKERLFEKGYFESIAGELRFNCKGGIKQYQIQQELLKGYVGQYPDSFLNWKEMPTLINNFELSQLGLKEDNDLISEIVYSKPINLKFIHVLTGCGKEAKKAWFTRLISESIQINLDSSSKYEDISTETVLFGEAIELFLEEEEILNRFRNLINFDSRSISELNIKNAFRLNGIEYFLSELLPGNDFNSEKYSALLKTFPESFRGVFEEKIFVSNFKRLEEIADSILELEGALNKDQLHFILRISDNDSQYKEKVKNLLVETAAGILPISSNETKIWYTKASEFIKPEAILSVNYNGFEKYFLDEAISFPSITSLTKNEINIGGYNFRIEPFMTSSGKIKIAPLNESLNNQSNQNIIFQWFNQKKIKPKEIVIEQAANISLLEFLGFEPKKMIWESTYALSSELLTNKNVTEIVNKDGGVEFFSALGVHSEGAPIVCFRKALVDKNQNELESNYHKIDKDCSCLIRNSFEWITPKVNSAPEDYLELIQYIQGKISFKRGLPIFSINKDGGLKFASVGSEPLKSISKIENQEYKKKITKYLIEDGVTLIDDENHPDWINEQIVEYISIPDKILDKDELKQNSLLLDNDNWNTFSNRGKYSIYAYPGEIPYKKEYGSLLLDRTKSGHRADFGDAFYINIQYHSTDELILECLSELDKDLYRNHIKDQNQRRANSFGVLDDIVKKKGYSTDDLLKRLKEHPELLDEIMKANLFNPLKTVSKRELIQSINTEQSNKSFDPEYSQELLSLLKGNNELSDAIKGSVHQEAIIRILNKLNSDYSCDFTEAYYEAGRIKDLIINGDTMTIIPHGAGGGILYLTPSQWMNFKDDKTWIGYILGNQVNILRSQSELISNIDYLLIRVKIDSVDAFDFIEKLPSGGNSHILFPTTQEIRKKLFEIKDIQYSNSGVSDAANEKAMNNFK